MATTLRDALTRRVEAEHREWLDELAATLAEGRVVRALRLSSRPPKAGVPLPSDLGNRLKEAAASALSADAFGDRWATVLDALAFSPVRVAVIPVGVPDPLTDEFKKAVAPFVARVPHIAELLGIDPATAPKPPKRTRPGAPKPGAPKPDGAKAGAPRPDAAKAGASKPDAPNPDSEKPEAEKPDAEKPDAETAPAASEPVAEPAAGADESAATVATEAVPDAAPVVAPVVEAETVAVVEAVAEVAPAAEPRVVPDESAPTVGDAEQSEQVTGTAETDA